LWLTHVITSLMENGQRPEYIHIADRNLTIKSYWAQWKSLAVRNNTLECNWESANGLSKMAQIIPPWKNHVPTELHGELSGGLLALNRILNDLWRRYYWFRVRKSPCLMTCCFGTDPPPPRQETTHCRSSSVFSPSA
jgi:hypothetical protein